MAERQPASLYNLVHRARWGLVAGFLVVLSLLVRRWCTAEERRDWGSETWSFAKQILPLLLAGVLVDRRFADAVADGRIVWQEADFQENEALATQFEVISSCVVVAKVQGESVLGSGLLYTVGRALADVGLGTAVMAGLMASSEVSRFLQTYLNEILGPVLILLGLVLLGMIGSGASLDLAGHRLQERVARSKGGVLFALPLALLFALSFCPVSAGLFFGALIPLSLKHGSRLALPLVYAAGTALPVVVLAFLIAFAGDYLGRAFSRLSQVETCLRRAAGVLFLLAGLYYCLTRIYGLRLAG